MSSLLLFLLCLTVYTCNARHLGIMENESSRQAHLPGDQESEKAVVYKTLIPSKEKLPLSGEVQKHRERISGANTQKLKDAKGPLPKGLEERTEAISTGTDQIIMHSSDVGLPRATTVEGFNRQVRWLLVESALHLIQVDSKENDINEDAGFMDYAKPHRKPPIHNISP